jgi:hypothetical protein
VNDRPVSSPTSRPDLGELPLEPGAERRVGAGELEAVEHRPGVERGPADEHGDDAARAQRLDRGPRLGLELRHRHRLGRVVGVEQVVRDPATLRRRRLRGADVHAPVDRHRVGVDDLAAEPLGEVEGERGLAGGGRADHGHDRDTAHGVSVATPRTGGTDVGFLDKLKKQATKAVDQHGDKIADGLDKAAQTVDKKTKGKYSDRITTGQEKAKDALDKLDGRKDGDLG